MQIGKLKHDVKIMATGFSREAGGTIAENEVPPAIWKEWVEEGVVDLLQPAANSLTRRERVKLRRRAPAIR